MAYSSAITICGGQDIYMASNNWVSYTPLILSMVVFVMILCNYKGARTGFALAITLISALLIFFSHQLLIPAVFYNLGGAGLLVATWINGNLMSFVRQVGQKSWVKRSSSDERQISYPINQK